MTDFACGYPLAPFQPILVSTQLYFHELMAEGPAQKARSSQVVDSSESVHGQSVFQGWWLQGLPDKSQSVTDLHGMHMGPR